MKVLRLYFLIPLLLLGCQRAYVRIGNSAGATTAGIVAAVSPSPSPTTDCPSDKDCDGLLDYDEYLVGRGNSLVTESAFSTVDTDKDGKTNANDSDSDGDGIIDGKDPYPTNTLDALGPTFALFWSKTANEAATFVVFRNTLEMIENPNVRTFVDNKIGITAQVAKMLGGEWALVIKNTGPNIIKAVVFPYETDKYVLNANGDDDLLYYPFRMGKVSRMKNAKEFTANDSSLVYPGSAFAPLTVLADDKDARIVASVTFPPKRVVPYWDFRRQYLKFIDPLMPETGPHVFRVLMTKVSGDASKGKIPWQMALDHYKLRLKLWMLREDLDPKKISPWMKKLNGWIAAGVMNNQDFRKNNIESEWNRWKGTFPWLQVWGQMSNYPAVNAYPAPVPGECVGCCMGYSDLHKRYYDPALLSGKKSLPELAAMITSQGGHFGYYSRPRTACDPAITAPYAKDNCPDGDPDGNGVYENFMYPLDSDSPLPGINKATSNKEYLMNWMTKLEQQYGANAHYIDVLACTVWAKDPLTVPRLYKENPAMFNNAAHECQIDYFPTMGLMSGSLAMTSKLQGGEYDTFANKTELAAPMFGRYIMDDHSLLLGQSNGDHIYYGNKNSYWLERQAFIMGMKFDVSTGWISEVPYDNNSPMNHVLRQSTEAWKALQWWDKDVKFMADSGLSKIAPTIARVARFKAKNGKNYLAIDNFRSLSSEIDITVDGVARSYAIPKDAATGKAKYVTICPVLPEDGSCQ